MSGGSGTADDPWIIQNHVLDKPSPIGFLIEATTDYFIIRNCDISGTNISGQIYGGNSGIMLTNVRNAVIIGNRFYNNTHGIQLYGCKNILIEDNHFKNNNQYGTVVSGESIHVSIKNNRYVNNGWGAIRLSESRFCSVTDCVMEDNADGYGIFTENSRSNTFSGNTIHSNLYGMFLRNSNENSIFGNDIRSNENGMFLQSCEDNVVFHNNFVNNTLHAFDDGQNQWHNASLKSGNHWDDYTGTGPYPIPGGSSSDEYPSLEPFEIYSDASASEWPIAGTIVIVAVAILVIASSVIYFVRKAGKKNGTGRESDTDTTGDGPRDGTGA